MTRLLIIFGLLLILMGLLWPLVAKLGLGRLPGDIVIERENFRLYLPLATSLLCVGASVGGSVGASVADAAPGARVAAGVVSGVGVLTGTT